MKNPKDTFPGTHRSPGHASGQGGGTARLGFPRGARRFSRGFALIISLSLMVLITLLAVGLLSLSTVSLRGSNRDEAAARARANARMALNLAIGQLQLRAGLDTRISARADILDQGNPPVLGIWKSWEGTDHSNEGRPLSPGNYKSKKEERFLEWMVSSEGKTLPDTSERPSSVALVGGGTVGNDGDRKKLQIHLEPVQLKEPGGAGAIAWWTGGENQKARLPKPYEPDTDSPARWSVLAKSHTIANPGVFRMEELIDDPSPAAKAITHQTGDFVGKKDTLRVSQEFFHDLSAVSTGLLTNTATGGWRKDLSLATENWGTLPNANLPFFRVTPEKDLTFSKPSSSSVYPTRSMIYPWASYRSTSSIPIYCHGAVSSWENLKNWALLYRDPTMTTTSSGRNRITSFSSAIDDTGNAYNFIHKVRLLPVVARVQWVFSHYAGPPPSTAGVPTGNLEPRLLLTPVITMWNPYNVEIKSPASLGFSLVKPLPSALRYNVGGASSGNYHCLFAGGLTNTPAMSSTTSNLRYEINAPFDLKPGETRVFSPTSRTPVEASATGVQLSPGYRAGSGQYFPILNAAGARTTAPPTATMAADAKFDTVYDDSTASKNTQGVGIYLDMSVPATGPRHLAYRMTYTPSMASAIYGSLGGLATGQVSKVAASPVAFMSTVFGTRMASRTHIPAKGFVQSSPLVNYTAMGSKDIVEETIGRHYLGTGHPVNSPFDYSFVAHPDGGGDDLPNASDATNRGYIVTGFQKGTGLSRCVVADIPVRPLQSLGELQGWDLRYENPIPPYAYNLIGNSDATPLIPSNAVFDSSNNSAGAMNLQYDDSYCANHMLFDDWFVSSITPDPTSYGNSGKNQKQAYNAFLTGARPLGNQAYRPIAEDAGVNSSRADELFSKYVSGANSWKSIASRLEVEGMFNVNSTSVAAWRALLGHARNQKVPYIKDSGSGWSVDSSEEHDHPFSRFAIAGDVETGKDGSSGEFEGASEFTGYRVLDDELIDKLAEEVVKQVRARGPFLSLSEFINRQLSSGDLALAGAIQSALNQLAKGAGNPYAAIQGMSKDASATPDKASDAEYRFPAAAAGESAYGLPGWTRQADVLRPLAPILSARDDTFVIRAHGDARDDKGKIVSRAVCEAVIQRTRNYVDATDLPDAATVPASKLNKRFGRHFEIISFRWLNPSEI